MLLFRSRMYRNGTSYSHRIFLTAALLLFASAASRVRGSPVPQTAPAKAPAARRGLTPPAVNSSDVQFHDVTASAGVHFHHERAASDQKLYLETMGAGVGWIDYDQDGF